MPDPVTLPTAQPEPMPSTALAAETADHRLSPPLPSPAGNCGAMPIQVALRDHKGHRKHRMADFDLEALSLSELRKLHERHRQGNFHL